MSPLTRIELTAMAATTAASATPTNASASCSPSRPIKDRLRLTIPGKAKPVTAAEYGLYDRGIRRVLLDLPAQVLDVRVDGPLVALEVVPAHPVDQFKP